MALGKHVRSVSNRGLKLGKPRRLKQRTRTSQARPVERPFASPPSSCRDRWCLLLLLGEVVLLLGDVVLLLLGDVEDSSAPLS